MDGAEKTCVLLGAMGVWSVQKGIWRSFPSNGDQVVIREALGGAQAHPNRALNRAFDEDDDGQFGSPAASLPPRSQPASHGPPPLSSEAEVRGEIESVSAVQFWSCACGTFW